MPRGEAKNRPNTRSVRSTGHQRDRGGTVGSDLANYQPAPNPRAHAQVLAEEQREDLWLVLRALAQELSAKRQHHDQDQRGDHIGPASPAHRPDAECGEQREHPQADEGVDADQVGAGGAGEGAIGNGVSREGRAPEHEEEADHPGDDRHELA